MAEVVPPKAVPSAEATAVSNFIGARQTVEKYGENVGSMRSFPKTPAVEAGRQQALMERDMKDMGNEPIDYVNKIRYEIEMKYVGRFVGPETMAIIRSAAIAENAIRDQVMAEMGVTPEGIRQSNNTGREKILNEVEDETHRRIKSLGDLWTEIHTFDASPPHVTDEAKNDTLLNQVDELLKKGEKVTPGVATNVRPEKSEEKPAEIK